MATLNVILPVANLMWNSAKMRGGFKKGTTQKLLFQENNLSLLGGFIILYLCSRLVQVTLLLGLKKKTLVYIYIFFNDLRRAFKPYHCCNALLRFQAELSTNNQQRIRHQIDQLFLKNLEQHKYHYKKCPFSNICKNIARGTTDPGY